MIDKIDEIVIDYSIIDKPPYVYINNDLPKIQKDLIYRVYIEVLSVNSSDFVSDSKKRFINEIRQQNYHDLCLDAIYNWCPIIVSYLISNNLVKDKIPHTVRCDFNKYSKIPYEYYISLIGLDMIKERTDIFNVYSFSRYIKYSDEFIDKHFDSFTQWGRFPTNENSYHVFESISTQKPPFEILVKHIGEFDLKHALKNLDLSEAQERELKLLEKITKSC